MAILRALVVFCGGRRVRISIRDAIDILVKVGYVVWKKS